MKKQSFLHGSLLLTGSAVAAKLLGALFKLPLTAVLGGTGMGYFSCAYGLFLPLYAVFVTGLSTAVARPTADCAGRGDSASALRIRTVARRLFLAAGLAGSLLAAALAHVFTLRTTGDLQALPAVLAMPPAVLLCCLTAVERGWYEGLCCMTPTAVSQAVEALAKLVCGLALCRLFLERPPAFLAGCSPEACGACGAVLGVTLSTLAGWLCVLAFRPSVPDTGQGTALTDSAIIRALLSIMLPAALGALVTSLTSLIDLVTVMQSFGRALRTDTAAFYSGSRLSEDIAPDQAAAFVYGSFMGLAVTVFTLVPSLTNMLAKSVLPCTAQAWSSGDRVGAAAYARQVLLLTGAAAIPAGCGMLVLAQGMLEFLFAGREAEIAAASDSLRMLAPGTVLLCMAYPVFSLLQAVGRADLPVKVMLPGAAVKLAGNLLLLPGWYAQGAALATTLCYGVILVPALISLRRVLGQPLHLGRPLAAMLYAGAMCAAAAWLCYCRVPVPVQRLRFLLAVVCGAAVYAAIVLVLLHGELAAFRRKADTIPVQ